MRDVPARLHGAVSFSEAWWEVHAESNDISVSTNSSAAKKFRLLKGATFGGIIEMYMNHCDGITSLAAIVVLASACVFAELLGRLPVSA